MFYYFAKTLEIPFDHAINKTVAGLEAEGFGVLTTIDVQKILKKKLDVEFPKYTILGVCNPHFALKALQTEDKIGTMLPCVRRQHLWNRFRSGLRESFCSS